METPLLLNRPPIVPEGLQAMAVTRSGDQEIIEVAKDRFEFGHIRTNVAH
jgi:hypothetical protein